MYETNGSHSICYASTTDADAARRLNWLRVEIARYEGQRKPWRLSHEERALAIRNPLTTEEAFAWFGTFLGLFPPFAIFGRILGVALHEGASRNHPMADGALYWGLLFLAMNAVCCLVGRKFGAYLGRRVGDPRAWSWPFYVFSSLVMAVAWAVVTGAAGGAVALIIGAVFGVVCAVPVALAAFPVFAVLHRLLSHGGMIEKHDLWPLAFGVSLTIAALILSPTLYSI